MVNAEGPNGFRSGFIGLVGRPNVGKSTLLNRFARRKIAITSRKPQTTRNRIQAVITSATEQMIFVDTPGFHKPHNALGERLNSLVLGTMRDVDAVVFVLDGSQEIGTGDTYIAGELEKISTPVVAVVNKTDLLDAARVKAQVRAAEQLHRFSKVLPVSSKHGTGVEALETLLRRYLPEGPMYFPADVVCDQPETVLVSEIIREKALRLTREEVPHSIAVMVEEMRPRGEKEIIDISAVIYVERESQKGIVVGKGGRMIREIGTRARIELEPLLGSRVFLDLRVKVEKDWTRNTEFIKRLDYQ